MNKNIFLLLAAVVTLLPCVSCKTQKNANIDNEEVSQQVEAAKVVLADEVVAMLDTLNMKFVSNLSENSLFINFNLTEREKMIKPDFLFNPEEANAFVTRAQKEKALAMLYIDLVVRENYDMPTDHSIKVIKEFMYDLNIPFDQEYFNDMSIPFDERLVNLYSIFKEREDVTHFWRLLFSAQVEAMYVISTNPDLYLRDVTPETFALVMERMQVVADAMTVLYEYDPETKEIVDDVYTEDPDFKFTSIKTLDDYKQYLFSKRDLVGSRRSELMKKFPLAGSGVTI